MSDVSGVAPAAVDSAPAPEAEVVQPPNPISTEPQQAEPEPEAKDKPPAKDKPVDEKKPISTRDALKKATEKVDADEKAKTTPPVKADAKAPPAKAAEAKPAPVKDERLRTETGQFAAKEGTAPPAEAAKPSNYVEAPTRFSADAKAAWKDAPEPVRAEVHRAVKELDQGLQKYKGDAEAFDQVRQFDELAKRSGTTLKDAMANYVGIEQKLQKDFIGGLELICQNKGVSLRQVAAQIMGQKPEEAAGRQDQTISELRQTVQQLQQQIGGVTKSMETQRQETSLSQVAQFAAQPGHERFEELATDIKFFLDKGRAATIDEAYTLAERLNPGSAPAVTTQTASAPAPDPTAQNRNGQKSITGAPGAGSAPGQRTPSKSIRDSLNRAVAAAL